MLAVLAAVNAANTVVEARTRLSFEKQMRFSGKGAGQGGITVQV